MTKEEAIKILDRMANEHFYGGHVIEACRLAIEALSTIESKGLDEAAEAYSNSPEPLYSPGHRFHWDDDALFGMQIETAFKAGAKWMAGQGYSSEAVVGSVILPDGEYRKVANFCSQSIRAGMDNLNLSKGDKVIVQIRKINEKEK